MWDVQIISMFTKIKFKVIMASSRLLKLGGRNFFKRIIMKPQSLGILKVCLKQQTGPDNLPGVSFSSKKATLSFSTYSHFSLSILPSSLHPNHVPSRWTCITTSKPVSDHNLGWPAARNPADWIWHSQGGLRWNKIPEQKSVSSIIELLIKHMETQKINSTGKREITYELKE